MIMYEIPTDKTTEINIAVIRVCTFNLLSLILIHFLLSWHFTLPFRGKAASRLHGSVPWLSSQPCHSLPFIQNLTYDYQDE